MIFLEIAIKENMVTEEELIEVLKFKKTREYNISFSRIFIILGYLTEAQVKHILALEKEAQLELASLNSKKPSRILNKYHILEELGKGGMGIVYKAHDIELDRVVALKFLKEKTQEKIKRFELEARILAKLSHPNIIKVYEVGGKDENYFAMEYVRGKNLEIFLKEENPTMIEILTTIEKVASAMYIAHMQNIVHRDMKPSNILMDELGEPKVTDFGLAKDISLNLSHTGDIFGTPEYMSPEQTLGKSVDFRSDIYSLGATLYKALVGKAPFCRKKEESIHSLFDRIQNEEPIFSPHFRSKELKAICLKCLEKRPENRYRDAKQLALDIQSFLSNKPIIAKPPNTYTYMKKFFIRHSILSISTLIVFLILFISTVFSLFQWKKTEKIAKSADVKVTKLLFQKALERSKSYHWAESGTLAGYGLEQIKRWRGQKEIENLYEKGKNIIRESIISYGLKNRIAAKKENFSSLAFHPSQNILAVSYQSGLVMFYDILKGTLIEKLSFPFQIKEIKFSPQKNKLILITPEKVLSFDLNKKEMDTLIKKKETVIVKFHFKFDLFVYTTRKNGLYIWKGITSKKHLVAKINFLGKITSLSFHPEQKKIFITTRNKEIFSYNIESKKLQRNYFNTERRIVSSSSSHNGKTFASGSENGISLWNSSNFQRIQRFKKDSSNTISHYAKARSLAFSNCDKFLISSAQDRSARIWDLATFKQVFVIRNYADFNCMQLDLKSNYMASGSYDNIIRVWDFVVKRNKEVVPKAHSEKIFSLAYDQKSKTLASSSPKEIKLWKINDEKLDPIAYFSISGERIRGISFHPTFPILAFSLNGKIMFLDIEKKEILQANNKEEYTGAITSIDFNRNGNFLASISSKDEKILKLWHFSFSKNITSLTLAKEIKVTLESSKKNLEFHNSKSLVRFSPTNENLLAFYFAGERRAYLTNISNNKPSQILEGHKEVIKSLRFHLKKPLLVTSSHDGHTKVWNVKTGKIDLNLSKNSERLYFSCFVPQRNIIASAGEDKVIKLWDAKTKRLITKLVGHSEKIYALDFLNNNTLISASLDQTLRIWKINNLQPWPFSYRLDVCGETIEKELDFNPKKVTEYLFERQINKELQINPFIFSDFPSNLKKQKTEHTIQCQVE